MHEARFRDEVTRSGDDSLFCGSAKLDHSPDKGSHLRPRIELSRNGQELDLLLIALRQVARSSRYCYVQVSRWTSATKKVADSEAT